MDVETIRAKVRAGKYIISFTHTEKVRLRKIEAEEIEQAIDCHILNCTRLEKEGCIVIRRRPITQ
jgi:hypothetical protein